MRFLTVGLFAFSALLAACASATEEAGEASADITGTAACLSSLECAAPPPPSTHHHLWRHWFETPAVVTTDATTGLPRMPNHRGRDLFVNPGASQTISAHFTYGLANVDLQDEDVEIFLQRDCGSGWEALGTATTTSANAPHPPTEGITDSGGRVFFEIPADKQLGPGRHRVRLVVKGDQSATELFIDVVPPRTPIFISDVDGTLTSSENVEFAAMLVGVEPATHPDAPKALRALARKGYRPMYLTARPEWLVDRTRAFLEEHGFPPGIIHTSIDILGAGFGASAATFKTGEMAMLAAKGLVPTFGFGNRTSDSDAYKPIATLENRFFYQIKGDFEGRSIREYTELLPQLSRVEAVCQK